MISIPSNARTRDSSPSPTSEKAARAALSRLVPPPPPPTHRVPAVIPLACPLARPPARAHRLDASIARVDIAHRVARATATADARRAFVAAAAATDEDEDAARASRSGVAHRVNMRESREEPTVRSRAPRASVSRSRSRRRASMSDGASE